MMIQLHRTAIRSLLLVLLFAPNAFAEKATETAPTKRAKQEASSKPSDKETSPPERSRQQTSAKGFSTSDVQFLYGSAFKEPGFDRDIGKFTVTFENSSGWRWGSSYFFVDYLRSNSAENHATEFYSEWYPSASIGKILGIEDLFPGRPLKDILITLGFNAGTKSTGAQPFVFLPGLTFDFQIPGFQFFSLGVYAYIDDGRFDGEDNGCNKTTYQITPSWSLPFKIGCARFRFDGFVDFIGRHAECSSQVVAQPTIKLDLGGTFSNKPDKLLVGVEWGYMKNKYGIKDLDQTAPQAVVMWVF
ncbi:MAG: hypothetical protein JSS07_06985 [Proteobacteria bacterium]|nr:hypothetical protein [Pseudomonadota bacterium]